METALNYTNRGYVLVIGIIISLLLAYFTAFFGLLVPILSVAFAAVSLFLILVYNRPFVGLMALLIYCFIFVFFVRELPNGNYFVFVIEALYLVIWVAIILTRQNSEWIAISNDLCILFSIWFLVSVLQLFNPAGPSLQGWLYEIRTSGLDSFLIIPAGFLLIRSNRHLRIFFIIVISCSLLATLNGVKQLHFGLFPGEQEFLAGNTTHMIWGQLRVFSFYGDAGQFGASQAHLTVICLVLAFGSFKVWKRILFLALALIFFYGMLISGTRGAFFVLVPGILLAVFLFKNIKVLIFGVLFLTVFLAVLKYTTIGSSFSYIHRFRSALNPEDASLNVRFNNQEILREYMKSYPFGGGLGIVGYGAKFNEGKLLSTVPPDSYWVKVWAMYGIVGFVFWFCMIMYVLGKCCGIVWNIRDQLLRVKLTALTAGAFGIFVSSYGNEVLNTMPSSITVYLSFVIIFLGPKMDVQALIRVSNNEAK